MLQFPQDKVCKLIDLLDVNITPKKAINEISGYFNIQASDVLSSFAIVNIVVPITNAENEFKFVLVKI